MSFEVVTITEMLKKSNSTRGRKPRYCWLEVAMDLWIEEGAEHTCWWLDFHILTRYKPYSTDSLLPGVHPC